MNFASCRLSVRLAFGILVTTVMPKTNVNASVIYIPTLGDILALPSRAVDHVGNMIEATLSEAGITTELNETASNSVEGVIDEIGKKWGNHFVRAVTEGTGTVWTLVKTLPKGLRDLWSIADHMAIEIQDSAANCGGFCLRGVYDGCTGDCRCVGFVCQ